MHRECINFCVIHEACLVDIHDDVIHMYISSRNERQKFHYLNAALHVYTLIHNIAYDIFESREYKLLI